MTKAAADSPSSNAYGQWPRSLPPLSTFTWHTHSTRVATKNGGSVHCMRFGDPDARPIVLLHGFGSDWHTWAAVALLLSDSFQVLVPDIPGFGKSSHPGHMLSVDGVVEQLDEFCRIVLGDDTPLVLAGHSLGAQAAAHWAATRSGRIDRFVVGSGPALSALSVFDDPLSAIRDHPKQVLSLLAMLGVGAIPFRRELLRVALADSGVRRFALGAFANDMGQIDDEFLRFATRNIGNGELVRTTLTGVGYQFKRIYSSITVPVAGMIGETDPLASLTDMNQFMDWAGGTDVTVIEDAGHFLSLEQPEAVASLISSWARNNGEAC